MLADTRDVSTSTVSQICPSEVCLEAAMNRRSNLFACTVHNAFRTLKPCIFWIYFKWHIRNALLVILISALAFFAPAKVVWAQCKPLLVLHGGAFDSRTKLLNPLKNWVSNDGARVEYFSWDDDAVSRRAVRDHLKQYPKSPIAVVGHSWGGDAAYGVAEAHGIEVKRGSSRIKLLITLDAVGGNRVYTVANFTEFRQHVTKPDGVEHWVNVWRDGPGALVCILLLGYVWNWDNCVADTGAQWGYQNFAQNIETEKDHADAIGMIKEIQGILEESLQRP